MSKEADINTENSYPIKGTYQMNPNDGYITVSIWLEQGVWNLFYSDLDFGTGSMERYSGEIEPVDDNLFLVNSDQLDYEVISLEKEYLMLIDTDNNSAIKINKVLDIPTTSSEQI